ncbi:E2 domain-associated cysteine-rich protein [Sinorhizobium meliloti]|uniref:E2 domain-associated cysteine-rich protein n=1 Tax=Rhizobium meliloti TaxID=382 RepID=UPI000FD898D7|nr:E2 domain-associated cysteine-rich protein [Sinorhizobium meliloti]MDW9928084.1 hypothetical protein [Sinorhizobium meliloti]MDX0966391.1 hypothetical protein [Sinorhizobium medicae]RVI52567.1 hypothetical protein CN195_10955 [Sinorhizobium meliloti]
MTSPLGFLEETAAGNHAHLSEGDDERAEYIVRPPLGSGAPAPKYTLEIRRAGGTVTVREPAASLLPPFCPERHINPDGTFCLYWAEAEPSVIDRVEAADEWWGKLLTFLLRQRTAGVLRSWPGKADARAHGSRAARFQAIAEEKAGILGPGFMIALRDERFSTRSRRSNGGPRVALLMDGRRMVSVLLAEQRVMTLRQRCKCHRSDGRRLPISACENHAGALAEFTLAMEQWRTADIEFFDELRNCTYACCGTMDNCPLADRGHGARDEAA